MRDEGLSDNSEHHQTLPLGDHDNDPPSHDAQTEPPKHNVAILVICERAIAYAEKP